MNSNTTFASIDQGTRPLIGVTLDAEQPGGYSKYPWYALRTNYADAIAEAGVFRSRCRISQASRTPTWTGWMGSS